MDASEISLQDASVAKLSLQINCRLCGVGFNISRIRRKDEPREAAWCLGSYAHSYVNASQGNWTNICGPETGCCVAVRKIQRPSLVGAEEYDEDEESDDEQVDPTYEHCTDEEDERYEFESDDSEDEAEEDEEVVGQDEDDEDDGGDRRLYDEFLEGMGVIEGSAKCRPDKKRKEETFRPLPKSEDLETVVDLLEHIAGPGCLDRRGYHGFAISTEEMRGCTTLQCLFRKDAHWRPLADDQDFELNTNYFLSGLNNEVPSRDDNWPKVTPARHGLESPPADDYIWDLNEQTVAMPFHPTCFEVFARASRLHFSRIDINGLMGWRRLESEYQDVRQFPRDLKVRNARQQSWVHEVGAEYLVANPIFVPALAPLLRSAIQEDPSFNAQHDAFPLSKPDMATKSAPTAGDPFLQLPHDITWGMLDYLGSRDIANLRLTSRAFRQLPVALWHALLEREMPWLWEVWSHDAPSFWTVTSVDKLKAEEDKEKKYESEKRSFESELKTYRDIIKEEMPEMWEDWCEAEPQFPNMVLSDVEPPITSMFVNLPRANTNWYQLYRDITLHWAELKGLQNRRRIWTDVEEIIRRIKKYREEGKIVD